MNDLRAAYLTATGDVQRARRRLRATAAIQAALIEKMVVCSLCEASIGESCFKPSGGARLPHAERYRMARAGHFHRTVEA